MQSHYQQAKQQLKQVAKEVKASHPKDKPAQRQTINDFADSLSRDFWRYTSEGKAAQWANWLHSYAASLH